MSQLTFNFCGADAIEDFDLLVNQIRMPVTPEISETVQDIPGMVGKIFLGNSYGQKIIPIEVTIKASNSTELSARLSDLADLVMTFGNGEYPMIFSINPNYTYYGHFNSISEPERINQNSSWRKVTLTFACSDPKGYGVYKTNDMTSNPVSILPEGNSECYPIFTCLPKKDVQKIAVTDEDGNYVFLGAGVDDDTGEAVQNLEPLVFTDSANDLSTWQAVTTPTFTLEGSSAIAGAYKNTADAITPSSWGNNVSGKWHGPLIQRWLPASYNDYRIRVRLMNLQYYARSEGKIEFYLLNSNGARIGMIGLKDNSNSKEVSVRVELGNGTTSRKYLYDSLGTVASRATRTAKTIKVKNGTKKVTPKKGKAYTVQLWKTVTLSEDLDFNTFKDFYGYIELQKIGNKYRVEIMKMTLSSNPGWKKPIVVTWTDTNNTFTGNALAGMALYTAKYDIYEDIADPRVSYITNTLQLTDIRVNNIINGGNSPTKPQTIARNGDEIKINSEDHRVYKNGGYFMDKFYIGSEFLTMQGGVYKTFAFEPSLNDADWYLEYTPTTS